MPPPSSGEDLPEVPGFEVLELLGRGTSGLVLRARDLGSGDEVALKILQPERSPHDEDARKRFRREAEALARMCHPNVVQLHGHGALPDGRVFLALELLAGRSLESVVKQAPLPAPRALGLVAPVAAALAHAHARGLIHRDVKPANVFLDQDGVPRLGDFGLAMDVRDEVTRLTRSGVFLGTPLYAAPEVLEGHPATPSSDVYSLALIAWVLLTGKHPYGWVGDMKALLRRLAEDVGALPEEVASPEVRSIIQAALSRQAPSRPDAETFGAALRAAPSGSGSTGSTRPAPPAPSTGIRQMVRSTASHLLASRAGRSLLVSGGLLAALVLWRLWPGRGPALLGFELRHGPRGVQILVRAREARTVEGVQHSEAFTRVAPEAFESEWLALPEGAEVWRFDLVGDSRRARVEVPVDGHAPESFRVLPWPPADLRVLSRYRVPFPALTRGQANLRLGPSFEVEDDLLDDLDEGWPRGGAVLPVPPLPGEARQAVLIVEFRGGARAGDLRYRVDGREPRSMGPEGPRPPFPEDPQLRVLAIPVAELAGARQVELLPPEGGRPRGRFGAAYLGVAGSGVARGGDLHVLLGLAQALVTQLDRRIDSTWDSLYHSSTVLDGLISRGNRWTRLTTLVSSGALQDPEWGGRADRLRELAVLVRERIRAVEVRGDLEQLEYAYLLHRSMVAFHPQNPVLLEGTFDVWANDAFAEFFQVLRRVAFSTVVIPPEDPEWQTYDRVVGRWARGIEGRYRAWAEYLHALGHLEARTNHFMIPTGLEPRVERLIDLGERLGTEWEPGTAGRAAAMVDVLVWLSLPAALSSERVGGPARSRWARTLVRLVEESSPGPEQARYLRYARLLAERIEAEP